MLYNLALREQAQRDLARLDPPVRRRIAERLDWVAEHFDEIQPEALTGPHAGLFKIRVGNYRVLYQFDRVARIITIVRVRHRREVYD